LQELNAEEFDLSLTGFSPKEIDDLLALPEEEEANVAPPLPENPVSRTGDLWICGKHRVLCGSSTSAEDVTRLLGERKPLLMVTDPPFEKAYRDARRAAVRQSTARLQQATSAAATTLLKTMIDPATPASVRIRAAEAILSHSAKAIEIEDIEVRVSELERSAEATQSGK
jgi:hypothetical protein